ILKAEGAQAVYLFGSVVDGTNDDYSDIDLAVSGLPAENFFQAMGKACDVLERPLDLIDLDEENLFSNYLKAKGKLLHVA
ncbi:nucleotidyltransferase domain-containing protein, partial [candidate division KSB1 bacterium]|nr:nucleotidyltransferase domain-containing protein [candidate division KSB1 bacterium]